MNGLESRGRGHSDADQILAALSTRQYLEPHRPLGDVLSDAQQDLGFCPRAGDAAVTWLNLDPRRAVGRLRRSELLQLARSIYRFWRQSLSSEAPYSQPA